jgi:hypothetical protein
MCTFHVRGLQVTSGTEGRGTLNLEFFGLSIVHFLLIYRETRRLSFGLLGALPLVFPFHLSISLRLALLCALSFRIQDDGPAGPSS